MKQMICILFCSAICLIPVSAEPAAGDPETVARELAGIRASLERLAVLLQASQAGERAQLLLRRIERKEVRLAGLESRLLSARSNKANDEEQLAQFGMYRSQMEEQVRKARERGEPGVDDQIENILLQTEAEEKRLVARIESLETQIRELEDQVAERREAIEDLDLRLEEILALMDESD